MAVDSRTGMDRDIGGYAYNTLSHDIWTVKNPPPVSRTALLGLGGAGGAMLATYVLDKIRKRKTNAKKLVIAAIAGAGAGVGASYFHRWIEGVPYKNTTFDETKLKPGDTVYLGVSGATKGSATPAGFPDAMTTNLPPGKVKLFRWSDGESLEKTYNRLVEKGVQPIIVGHSRGGRTAAMFLHKHPEATGYLIDPTSYTGRVKLDNATIFTTDPSTRHQRDVGNYISDIGGRWNRGGQNTLYYLGSHSNRSNDIVRDFVAGGYSSKSLPEKLPWYIMTR